MPRCRQLLQPHRFLRAIQPSVVDDPQPALVVGTLQGEGSPWIPLSPPHWGRGLWHRCLRLPRKARRGDDSWGGGRTPIRRPRTVLQRTGGVLSASQVRRVRPALTQGAPGPPSPILPRSQLHPGIRQALQWAPRAEVRLRMHQSRRRLRRCPAGDPSAAQPIWPAVTSPSRPRLAAIAPLALEAHGFVATVNELAVPPLIASATSSSGSRLTEATALGSL